MLQRTLEPEVMDTWEEAVEYDAMDFAEVNDAFAQRALELGPPSGLVLDEGTGTARIPILIAQLNPSLQVTGIDLSSNMLKLGEANVIQADLAARITLRKVDVKHLPFADNRFDFVISNSLIHHMPDPRVFFLDLNRVLKPNAGILIRDLLRPESSARLEETVKRYTLDCTDRQRRLFRDSLLAALTMKEAEDLLAGSGIHGARVVQSSDRHWSIERKWYRELKKDFPLAPMA